jgi:putative peptidoglycan lipid II flippase
VPVLGAGATLLLIVLFTKWWGIFGVAVATTIGLVLQALLLLPIALRTGHYRMSLNLRHPGVVQILSLLVPLLLVNLITKSTQVVERFFASSMSEGSISHLNYAFRLSSVAILLFSTGITTVIFPRMAVNVAQNDMAELRNSMSSSLRFMWLAVAPAITLGIALAVPIVSVAFLRGKFHVSDTLSVASLLQIYLLSLVGACLGNITSRSFYVLKDTRTIAVIGSIESVAYLFYTYYLAHSFGIIGVAWGYVILFNVSLLWQVIVLRYKTGNVGGITIISSFTRVGTAAVIAGIVTWGLSTLMVNVMLQLILCGSVGVIVYLGAIFVFRVPEARILWNTILISVK